MSPLLRHDLRFNRYLVYMVSYFCACYFLCLLFLR